MLLSVHEKQSCPKSATYQWCSEEDWLLSLRSSLSCPVPVCKLIEQRWILSLSYCQNLFCFSQIEDSDPAFLHQSATKRCTMYWKNLHHIKSVILIISIDWFQPPIKHEHCRPIKNSTNTIMIRKKAPVGTNLLLFHTSWLPEDTGQHTLLRDPLRQILPVNKVLFLDIVWYKAHQDFKFSINYFNQVLQKWH